MKNVFARLVEREMSHFDFVTEDLAKRQLGISVKA
jgi:hypothetical protein